MLYLLAHPNTYILYGRHDFSFYLNFDLNQKHSAMIKLKPATFLILLVFLFETGCTENWLV